MNPDYSLEGLMLKLQYFGHLMQRADSFRKALMLGKIEDKRRRVQQRIRWIDSITNSVDMNLSKLWEIVKDRKAWCAAVHGLQRSRHDLVAEQQQQQISNSLHRWRENSKLGVRYEEILRMQNSKMNEGGREMKNWTRRLNI